MQRGATSCLMNIHNRERHLVQTPGRTSEPTRQRERTGARERTSGRSVLTYSRKHAQGGGGQHAQAPGGNRPQRGNRPRSSTGERAGSPPAGAPRYTHGSYTRSNPQALGPRTSTSSNHGPSQSSWSIFLSPSAVLRHGAFDQRLRSATSRSSVRPSAIRTSKSSPSSSASTNAANAPSSTLT